MDSQAYKNPRFQRGKLLSIPICDSRDPGYTRVSILVSVAVWLREHEIVGQRDNDQIKTELMQVNTVLQENYSNSKKKI